MTEHNQPRIFLCHASEDKPQVEKLYHQLKEAGYAPWLDKYDLIPGQNWQSAIKKIITAPYNLVVVCLSQQAVTKRAMVQREIKWALDVLDEMPEDTIFLIPARLEPCDVPERLSDLHWVNLFEGEGFDNLKRALDTEIGKRQPHSSSPPVPPHSQPPTGSPKPVTTPPTLTAPPQLPQILSPQHAFEPKMILIPAGEFLMGSDPKVDKDAEKWEQPQHRLYLPDYYMAKTPVTNAQYVAFVRATHHRVPDGWQGQQKPPQGQENHPVTNVTWREVMAYCDWLSKTSGQVYRLPTEAEWEKAARGVDGRLYPWGNHWDPARCNTREGGPGDTTPVDAYPEGASPYGLLDMAGNVFEWTGSLWGKDWDAPAYGYPYDPRDGREELNIFRVVRSGSYYVPQQDARCGSRDRSSSFSRSNVIGFRIVAPVGSGS